MDGEELLLCRLFHHDRFRKFHFMFFRILIPKFAYTYFIFFYLECLLNCDDLVRNRDRFLFLIMLLSLLSVAEVQKN